MSSLLVPLMFGMTVLRSLLEGTCLSSGPEGTEEANEGEESSGTNELMGLLSANSCASMSYPFSAVWDSVQLLMHALSASALSRVTRCQNGLALVTEYFLWFKQLVDFFPHYVTNLFLRTNILEMPFTLPLQDASIFPPKI